MNQVTTRFAPSPTGFLHVGSLRTALYAYALAKHEHGTFILRIEDTDQKREVEGATQALQSTLQKFNLQWDALFIQSERHTTGIYKNTAEKLVAEGYAFYCQCQPKNAKEAGFSVELRDPCRDKNLKSGAIKLKVPENKTVSYYDFVHKKEISWNTNDVYDATLLKSDGFPTYHLAAMTDDIDMKVSHILRGHDWLPSTPIHLLVFEYLGQGRPEIGHLTDILSATTGKKLSKRRDSVFAEQFLEEGYLPEALLNFVMLLGWAPKDNRELFTLEEFVEQFDIKGFGEANPKFLTEKLDWFNGQYIQKKTNEELTDLLLPYLEIDREKMLELAPLVKERIKKLSDVKELAGFLAEKPETIDMSLLPETYKDHLSTAKECIESADWTAESLTNSFMEKIKEKEFKVGDFFMTLRVTMSGKKYTPPITECIILLGKDESLSRIQNLL